MRPRCRALTLTELLTVVSVITILASMISPVLIRGRQEALRHACIGNLSQMYRALGLYANGNFGKFPRCFDTTDPNANSNPIDSPEYSSWWYRKIWRIANPTLGELGSAAITANQCFLRCPATRDPFEGGHAPGYYATVKDTDTYKDRVFDDCYGYNNAGYISDASATPPVGYGFVYSNAGALPAIDPRTYKPPYYGVSKYYRSRNADTTWGTSTAVQGRYLIGDGKECPQCRSFWFAPPASCPTDSTQAKDFRPVQFGYIGAWSDIAQAASTILISDYAKADASPFPSSGSGATRAGIDEASVTEKNLKNVDVTTAATGYSFRHGGKVNLLFAAGNIEGFSATALLSIVGTPKAHWQVYR